MGRLLFLCVVVIITDYASGSSIVNATVDAFSQGCMKCICQVEGCERNIGKCRMDVGSLSCGPYQIKENYWIDCGQPGLDWMSCGKQMACSEKCVKAYMARYGTRCTKGREPTCRDYARIHNGGPMGCRPQTPSKERNLEAYWAKVKQCCSTKHTC
ncbi:hypothetical protein LSH36_304g02071 [Paralvinella palmiformis]|uniref:lysozyme n=1 Tax=Paralvinella palmiformis TaxID=53620 RepID=A0AAD9N115_9ANNE|nr:hypothetical protein LSH36_304g02071 [Paralvinella palmiformis]